MAVAIGIYQVFFGLSLKESPATGLEFGAWVRFLLTLP